MKALNTYNRKELNSMTLTEITDYNNVVCKEIGTKVTKRFATKPKAVEATLKSISDYNDNLEMLKGTSHDPKGDKPAKSNKSNRDQKVSIVNGTPKEESTEYYMFQCINDNLGTSTIGEIITHVKKNYKRPSGQPMEDKLILRRLRKAINNDHLKIEK